MTSTTEWPTTGTPDRRSARTRRAQATVEPEWDPLPFEERPRADHRAPGQLLTALIGRLRSAGWLLVVPFLAAGGWTVSLLGADPRDMTSLGLLSLFSPLTYASLLVLVAGFLISLARNKPEWVSAVYVITYLALIHGTPAVLYGTLRYSWAYKHVGIVDFIQRTGTVDPSIAVGAIYHNWPGFFTGSALLTELAGSPSAMGIASWAPLAFNLMNLVMLRYVYRGLTRNRRLIWLGIFVFFAINWVGQDYFSPQAMAYVCYLAVVGLLIRRSAGARTIIPFALLVAVVAASHQITPMMLLMAVTALVVLRRTSGWYLPLVAGVLIAGWAFTAARDYTWPNLMDLVVGLGKPVANASETLEKTATIATGTQQVVIWGGRYVVVLATVVALIGVWRSWRLRGLRVTAILLMVLPGVLVGVTGFGGEVLFRSFLFAAPFIAFLAAAACLPRNGRGFPRRNVIIALLLSIAVLPGFLLGYYGKEHENYFTPAEVSAVAQLDRIAKPGSLLVEGSRNYPTQFLNYERFTYVPIDREPQAGWESILADPAGRLDDWLSDRRYTDAYVLITRSQKIAVDDDGSLPAGSMQRVEDALRASPKFRVVIDTGDAVVFTLADRGSS